jgi:hypothetical protein
MTLEPRPPGDPPRPARLERSVPDHDDRLPTHRRGGRDGTLPRAAGPSPPARLRAPNGMNRGWLASGAPAGRRAAQRIPGGKSGQAAPWRSCASVTLPDAARHFVRRSKSAVASERAMAGGVPPEMPAGTGRGDLQRVRRHSHLRSGSARARVPSRAGPKAPPAARRRAHRDSSHGHEVGELLRRLGAQEGTGVVIVSHDERLEGICDRVLRLEDGSLRRAEPESGKARTTGPGSPRCAPARRGQD